MKKTRIFNILIVTLTIFALYQTYTLWFIHLANPSDAHTNHYVTEDLKDTFMKPSKIVYELDPSIYDITYDITDDTDLYESGIVILREILNNGIYLQVDYNEIYENRDWIVSFDYNYDISEENIEDSLDENSLLHIPTFNKVIFIHSQDNLYIFFNKDNEYTCMTIDDKDYLDNFLESYTNTLNEYNKDYHYTLYNGNYVASFKNELTYNLIDSTNPFSIDNEIHINSVESQINQFFENPLSKNQSIQNETGAITFSDRTTITRYYPDNIFEYRYYQVYNYNDNINLIDYYNTAANFINNDTSSNNNYYLDSYSSSSDSYTFYFNYSLGEFPIMLSNSYKTEHNINSAIEITVTNNEVTTYRKIPYNLSLSSETTKTTVAATDIVGPSYNAKIDLAYQIDDNNPLYLYWFISTDDTQLVQPTQ